MRFEGESIYLGRLNILPFNLVIVTFNWTNGYCIVCIGICMYCIVVREVYFLQGRLGLDYFILFCAIWN